MRPCQHQTPKEVAHFLEKRLCQHRKTLKERAHFLENFHVAAVGEEKLNCDFPSPILGSLASAL